VCGRSVNVPVAAPDGSFELAAAPVRFATAPQPQSQAMMTCPACAETIAGSPTRCPHCGEALAAHLSKEDQAALLEAAVQRLDAHLASPSAREQDERIKGGWLTGKTYTAIVFTVLPAALAIMGLLMRRDGEGLIVMGVIFGIIALICFAVSMANDAKANTIRTAPSPETACRNFLTALKTGRANKAFVALVPSAREVSGVKSIEFKNPKIPAHTLLYIIRDSASFKTYWKSVFAGPSGQNRTVAIKRVWRDRMIGSDMAIVNVELNVTNYPSWVILLILVNLIVLLIVLFALQKKENKIVKKLLIKRGGEWFVAESALHGDLDELSL
jgi:hypothetical protein